MWEYYDFNSNWDAVYKIIQSDEIQNVLKDDMDDWCINETDNKRFKYREPLWEYSRTDYFSQKILDKANEHMEEHDIWSTYKKHYKKVIGKSLFKKNNNSDDDSDNEYEGDSEIYNNVFNEIEELYRPKKGSLESMVLVMGANYLALTYVAIAEKLFFNEEIIIFEHACDNFVLIPSLKLIFDINRYYFYNDCKQKSCKTALSPEIIGLKFESENENENDWIEDID